MKILLSLAQRSPIRTVEAASRAYAVGNFPHSMDRERPARQDNQESYLMC
jgi:hypothetical protein